MERLFFSLKGVDINNDDALAAFAQRVWEQATAAREKQDEVKASRRHPGSDTLDLRQLAMLHPMLLNPPNLLVSQGHLEVPTVKPGVLRKSTERVRNVNFKRLGMDS